MATHANIRGFFNNVRERIEEKAEQNYINALPFLSDMMHDYAVQELKKMKKASMTGNFINSFGIALYKDGQFVAIGTTHEVEGKNPIQMTLVSGDTFRKGRKRYDGRKQFHTFNDAEGDSKIFANEEVVRYLQRFPPTKKKGFSFKIVSVVDYSELVGGHQVLLRIAEDMENYGGEITQINLG